MSLNKPYIKIEYDKYYSGGEYSSIGNFVYIPLQSIEEDEIERAFELYTGLSPLHIIHYSPDELYTETGDFYN
jgi:hypothetical protein